MRDGRRRRGEDLQPLSADKHCGPVRMVSGTRAARVGAFGEGRKSSAKDRAASAVVCARNVERDKGKASLDARLLDRRGERLRGSPPS